MQFPISADNFTARVFEVPLAGSVTMQYFRYLRVDDVNVPLTSRAPFAAG